MRGRYSKQCIMQVGYSEHCDEKDARGAGTTHIRTLWLFDKC